jgi:hypothetical protein
VLRRLWIMFVFSTSALGASRVIVTTPEPLQIFVDGMMVPMSIGTIRTAIPHIEAGEHTIAIHSLTGSPLYSERIAVPEGADVRVQYIPGAPFTITGAGPSATGAVDARAASQVAGAAGITTGQAAAAAQTPSAAQPANPTTGEVIEGAAVSTTRASGLQRVMTTPTPTNILTNSARGLQSMTAGAKAGVSFGATPPAAQTIKRANVVYGQAVFKKTGGGPLMVYEDGHLLASLGPGAVEVRIKIEVGRRVLEVRSGEDYRVLYQGDFQVDQSHVEQLNLSESTPPTATVRPWLWSDY